jgi:general secretion pathway protein I
MSPSSSSAGAAATPARGFTLLEVLIAFAILAIALVALFRAFGTGATNARLSEEYTVATLHAESILAAAGVETSLQAGASEGDLSDGYRWRVVVTRVASDGMSTGRGADAISADPLAGLMYEVAVTVSWRAEGKTRSVALRSYRLGAAP